MKDAARFVFAGLCLGFLMWNGICAEEESGTTTVWDLFQPVTLHYEQIPLEQIIGDLNARAGGVFFSAQGLSSAQLRQKLSFECDGYPLSLAARYLARTAGLNGKPSKGRVIFTTGGSRPQTGFSRKSYPLRYEPVTKELLSSLEENFDLPQMPFETALTTLLNRFNQGKSGLLLNVFYDPSLGKTIRKKPVCVNFQKEVTFFRALSSIMRQAEVSLYVGPMMLEIRPLPDVISIPYAKTADIPIDAGWDSPAWKMVPILPIDVDYSFRREFRPVVECKLQYTKAGIWGIFHVKDRYVRALSRSSRDPVWLDSCVEFYAAPSSDNGYFNLEINCGGTFLMWHIRDHRIRNKKFVDSLPLDQKSLDQIQIHATLPKLVDPEIREPITWNITFFVPFSLYEKYAGPVGNVPGSLWRMNLYKCAGNNSIPHSMSFVRVPSGDFHSPEYFSYIRFEKQEESRGQ